MTQLTKPARMVALRMYLCASSALTAYSVVTTPNVFPSHEGVAQFVAFALLVTICMLGVFDTFVNDVLGPRWALEWSEHWRNHLYLCLSGINLCLIFVIVNRGVAEAADVARYSLDAGMAVYVALRDVQIRFIEPRKESKLQHAERL